MTDERAGDGDPLLLARSRDCVRHQPGGARGVTGAAIGGVVVSVATCSVVLGLTGARPIAAVLAADE